MTQGYSSANRWTVGRIDTQTGDQLQGQFVAFGPFGRRNGFAEPRRFGDTAVGGFSRIQLDFLAHGLDSCGSSYKRTATSGLYRSRPETTQTRSASEVGKSFPRLRFGLVWNVPHLTGSGLRRFMWMATKQWMAMRPAQGWACQDESAVDARKRSSKAFLRGFGSQRAWLTSAWFKKGSGTFVRSTLRAVPAKVPDPFLNHALTSPVPLPQPALGDKLGCMLPPP